MAILNGTDLILKVAADGGSKEIIGNSTSCSLDISVDERDMSTKDSKAWKAIGTGMKSYSISCEALYVNQAVASAQDFAELFELALGGVAGTTAAGTKIDWEMTLNATLATGDRTYSGEGYITSLSLNAGLEESASYSVTIAGTGGIVQTTT